MSDPFYSVEGFDSRRSIAYLMRRATKLFTARIEALFTQADISYVQWVILMHLREGLSKNATELSQYLCHDTGALTRVIDQMEERGLLQRVRSTEDRRVLSLELTEGGRNVIDLHLPRVLGVYNELLGDFTHEELESIITLTGRLIGKLEQAGG